MKGYFSKTKIGSEHHKLLASLRCYAIIFNLITKDYVTQTAMLNVE